MKILIDAFGGDHSPNEVILGTVNALKEKQGFTAVLVGDEQIIKQQLSNYQYDENRVEIIHAPDVITCEEEPTLAVRRKPESSICVAFKHLKEDDQMNAFVSAGSTGAVLVGATLRLGRIAGVNRPALCPVLPTMIEDKQVYLMDSGANADCKPINICQFALMASAYAEATGVTNPKVALLSNGTEDEKGNMLNHEVFPILKKMQTINFVGNIEARDILTGEYDVVITDGFAGNVALKAMEGTVNTIFSVLKSEIYSTFTGKLGGMLLKKTFKKIKARMDYNNKGGALFVGVNKTVIKAHGSSKNLAIKNAILQAVSYSESNVATKVKERIEAEPIPMGE